MTSKLVLLSFFIMLCRVKGNSNDWLEDALETWNAGVAKVTASTNQENPSKKKTSLEAHPTNQNLENRTPQMNTEREEKVYDSITVARYVTTSQQISSDENSTENGLKDSTIHNKLKVTDYLGNVPELVTTAYLKNSSKDATVISTTKINALNWIPSFHTEADLETVTGIQGILTEMNTNEIIEKKIIDAMNEFSSNCNIYESIKLSVKQFSSPSLHKLRLGDADAIFTNLKISESDDENEDWKNYSTTIGCDSSNTVEIQVSVPPKIMVSADIHIIDSSNEVIRKGSISLTATGINVLKQFIVPNDTNDGDMQEVNFSNYSIPSITFEKSEVSLTIDMAYQIPIYLRLNVFLSELRPLRDFFTNQLRSIMRKRGITLSKTCSKILHMGDAQTKTDSQNTDLHKLYVIPDIKFETWKGLTLSAGPILIEGLLNFNRSEFMVVKPERRLQNNIIQKDYPPENKVIKRIKTDSLRGKFEWQYRLKKHVLPFTIDYIDFESIFIKGGKSASYQQDPVIAVYEDINKSMNVIVGKVEVEPSESKACENENHFANFILSGYLQSLIADSLKNSIQNKLISELLLKKCDNF